MEGEDALAVSLEQHQVRLSVPRSPAVICLLGTMGQGEAVLDERGGPASPAPAPTPFRLAPGQETAPVVILGAADLGIDEPVNAFVGSDRAPQVKGEAAGHLVGGQAPLQPGDDLLTQPRHAVQPRAGPAAGPGLLAGIDRMVALGD